MRVLPLAATALLLLLGLKAAGFGAEISQLVGSGEARAADEAAPALEPAASHDAAGGASVDPAAEDAAGGGPTASEADVLERLSERRAQLEQRERDLDMREKMIQAAEKKVEERIGELKEIEARIEASFDTRDAQSERQMLDLVKMYETMKPANAAAIYNTLEQGVLIGVVSRMKPAKASPILAAMKPERAQEVTVELARRKALPDEDAPTTGPGG